MLNQQPEGHLKKINKCTLKEKNELHKIYV
jgi:hypothetical protein